MDRVTIETKAFIFIRIDLCEQQPIQENFNIFEAIRGICIYVIPYINGNIFLYPMTLLNYKSNGDFRRQKFEPILFSL